MIPNTVFKKLKKLINKNLTQQVTSNSASIKITGNTSTIETRIGQFRLKDFAIGGICEVKKGIPVQGEGNLLAVKLIREEWYQHTAVRKQFSQESQIVKELKHPALPQYISRGLVDGKPYYAYKLIDGIPLIKLWQDHELLHPSKMNQLAPDMIKQLLEQLAYLHNSPRAIIHGDISSENIILDKHHHLHLIDFGCAHFQNMADSSSFQWVAKPSFISPEQARGQAWDHRSDLYQAGVLFYELISGRRWHRGENNEEKILYAASMEKIPVDFLTGHTDIHTSTLISHMLDPNPVTRLESANRGIQLINEMQRIQQEHKARNKA